MKLLNFKNIFYFVTPIIIWLHFLKDTFTIYYFILCLLIIIGLFFFILERRYNEINYKDILVWLFFFYFISLITIFFITFINLDRFNISMNDLIIAFGRLLIGPVLTFAIFNYFQNKGNIDKILKALVILFLIAVISIFIQIIYGHIPFFGNEFYHTARYGIYGYSSIIGSVVAYGVSFYTPVLYVYLRTHNHYFKQIFKGFIISIIFIGAVLAMSKAGLINVVLCLFIMSLFVYKNQNYIIFATIILFTIIAIYTSDTFYTGLVGLYANTTGHEIVEGTINTTHYHSIIDLAIERVSLRFFPEGLLVSKIDYIFGVGVYGSAGALGISGNTITTHNAYVDIYFMGGIISILALIGLMSAVQLKLISIYLLSRNEIELILIFSNFMLFFNMLFFNGALIHPVIASSFWISIAYLISLKSIVNK